MKVVSKKLYGIVGLVVFVLIVSVSIVSAQNGKGNNNPPSEPNNSQNQHEQQHQIQNQTHHQDCVNDCDNTQENQNQANDGAGTQNHVQNQNQNQVDPCIDCPMLDVDLPDDVVAAMNDGLLDEYAAYEVYSAIIAQLGEVIPFTNIQNAEDSHIWVWEKMFDKYGLELPVSEAVDVPTFNSVAEACAYALEIELENVALYDDMLVIFEEYTNLSQLTEALQSASLNHHIPALEQCVAQ